MDLQEWCSARRGFPVVAGFLLPARHDIPAEMVYVFADGRRRLEANDTGTWLDPLPGTEAAHEWAFQQRLDHPTVEAP